MNIFLLLVSWRPHLVLSYSQVKKQIYSAYNQIVLHLAFLFHPWNNKLTTPAQNPDIYKTYCAM